MACQIRSRSGLRFASSRRAGVACGQPSCAKPGGGGKGGMACQIQRRSGRPTSHPASTANARHSRTKPIRSPVALYGRANVLLAVAALRCRTEPVRRAVTALRCLAKPEPVWRAIAALRCRAEPV